MKAGLSVLPGTRPSVGLIGEEGVSVLQWRQYSRAEPGSAQNCLQDTCFLRNLELLSQPSGRS